MDFKVGDLFMINYDCDNQIHVVKEINGNDIVAEDNFIINKNNITKIFLK